MAKKKKIKNVVINNQELTPTVLGYIQEKNGSPIFLILVFGIFLTFLYFVPEVNKYIEKKRGNDYSNNVPFVPEKNETVVINDIGKELEYKDDLIITIKDLTFTDFLLESDELSFKITNISKDIIEYDDNKLYLYLKDIDGMINDIIGLDDIVILEKKSKDYSYKIDSINIKNIIVDELKEEYLPDVSLNDNKLVCNLDQETYTYEFNDSKYIKLTQSYINTYPLESVKSKYSYLKSQMEKEKGVTITYDGTNGINFNMIIETNEADLTKIKSKNAFNKDASAKLIKFKMEERGFSCS